MIDLADCFIALPGGIGTLDEISEVMTDIGLGQAKGKLILFNVDHFYDSLSGLLGSYLKQGFLKEEWKGWPLLCSNVEEIATALGDLEGKHNA